MSRGPLAGLRVVELGSIGPGPFCAMMLADHGADVVRIDRPPGAVSVTPASDPTHELLHRGRRSISIDLGHPAGAETVLRVVERADVFIEGQRPGVAERLGVGPAACFGRNQRLIYGRMTGWGQDGPDAKTVGHDLNYLAKSGTLSLIGRAEQPPTVPLALLGDFGGGGLPLAFGVLAALVERHTSNRGQVVDAAVVDGAALLATPFHGYLQTGEWAPERGRNLVDGGAPYYDVYLTADEGWLSVAAIEPRFYAELLDVLEIDATSLPAQNDRRHWPEIKRVFADRIRQRTLAEWMDASASRDACLEPVLNFEGAVADPHNQARQTFVEQAGIVQPRPAPRFARTPSHLGPPPPRPGQHTAEVLRESGFTDDEIRRLISEAAVQESPPSTAPEEHSPS